jgi:hypothetical protein
MARPIFFELVSGRPLKAVYGFWEETLEPYMESLILAQNERWRRA